MKTQVLNFRSGLWALQNEAEPSYFSWNTCDGCETELGGNRFDIQGYNSLKEAQSNDNSTLIELSVCVDCYQLIQN